VTDLSKERQTLTADGYQSPSALNRPHPPHSQAHLDSTDSAYTRCPRCASYLIAQATHEWFRAFVDYSLAACRFRDPGKPIGCKYPVLHKPSWPSTFEEGLGTFITLHPPPSDSPFRGLIRIRIRYNLPTCLPLSEQTELSPSLQGLLHPGFRRFGRPHRRRISLQWQLGKFHWRDLPIYTRQNAN
jgi:hypothetical protein